MTEYDFYILPTIILSGTDEHVLSVEFRWLYFGFGIERRYENNEQ